MLKELSLSFYAKCVNERNYMIYMNDETDYHIFKLTAKWRHENDLKRMHWSTQSSDLNFIENLWRLIKLRISDRRHRVHSVEEMKGVIEDEWNMLTLKNFKVSIESMQRRCQIVIKTRERMTKYWSIKSFKSWFLFRNYVFYLINWRCRDEVIIWMWGDQEIWGVVSEPVDHFWYPIVLVQQNDRWWVETWGSFDSSILHVKLEPKRWRVEKATSCLPVPGLCQLHT
jgi:hypothetical protein